MSAAPRPGLALALALALVAPVVGGCERNSPARADRGAAAPQQGKVRITSHPTGAAVFIGERQRVGRTPMTLTRPAFDRVRIELVKQGYQREHLTALVEPGVVTKVHGRLQRPRGTLVVQSGLIKGARVEVDGKYRGRTPIRVKVSAGLEHRLEVSRDGFLTDKRVVTVEAGEHKQINVMLPREGTDRRRLGWLSVDHPQPCKVHLNGKLLGAAPIERIPLPVGRYRIELRGTSDRLLLRRRVRIRPGKETRVSGL